MVFIFGIAAVLRFISYKQTIRSSLCFKYLLLVDEAEELINNATSEFLVRTDWNCNIQCSDKISTILNVKVYVIATVMHL